MATTVVPVFEFTRITKKYVRIPVTAVLATGAVATLAGLDVALLPTGSTVTGATTWTAATWASGVATVLLAGPDATATGALTVPAGGGDLYGRVTDSPEVDAVLLCRIKLV